MTSPPNPLTLTPDGWFEYPIRVHPHHTDYAGIVWHGTYIRWMEEIRVQALAETGVAFEQLVEAGCDLPVVDLQIRYRQAMRMGRVGVLRAKVERLKGVRLIWNYELWSVDREVLHLTAQVTLVAVNWESGKIMRRLPEVLQKAIAQISS